MAPNGHFENYDFGSGGAMLRPMVISNNQKALLFLMKLNPRTRAGNWKRARPCCALKDTEVKFAS